MKSKRHDRSSIIKIENEMVDTGNIEITKIDKDNKAPLGSNIHRQDERVMKLQK